MLLLGLTIIIAALRRAIRVSDKLSPKTWDVLTGLCIALLALSSWGLYKSSQLGEPSKFDLAFDVSQSSNMGKPKVAVAVRRLHFSMRKSSFASLAILIPSATLQTAEIPKYDPLDFRKLVWPMPNPSVQLSSPEAVGIEKNVVFWLSLITMIVSTAGMIATQVFSFIGLHRKRTEGILMRLEIEKRGLEIEQLRLEMERARGEHEASKVAASKIILMS